MGREVIFVMEGLLEKAQNKYGASEGTHDSQNDVILQELIPELFLMIEAAVLQRATVKTTEVLDFEEYYDDEGDVECVESESSSTQASQGWGSEEFDGEIFTIDQMKKIVDHYSSVKKGNRFAKTQRRYPRLKHPSVITRFKTYIDQNGRKTDKLEEVEKHVLEKFQQAREKLAYVSESDLKRWGVMKAKNLELDFQASHSWVDISKKRHRIVSRKVTKFVTLKEILERPQLQQVATDFVENVKSACLGIPSKFIFNYDQSGFNYEKTSQRTLSSKGEKDVLANVQSKHAISHSYTIMPMVSMAGRLSPKLLLCLQEKGGTFGPRVAENLSVPPNIFLLCSKSGKLDKCLMKKWVTDCVASEFSDTRISLLYDSWTGQTDVNLYESLKNCERFKIPAKTTSFIQPLDVYFFRQYKIVFRKLSDYLMLTNPDVKLSVRENVLTAHSLIYNQFQSDKFYPMLQYSWYACGYLDERPGYFYNANEILFNFSNYECDEFDCMEECFIACSHCGSQLCIKHFFFEKHFHISQN